MIEIVYHGSEKPVIGRLTTAKCSEGWPFGPAIYTTLDKDVARCYSGRSGVLYELQLAGNWELSIDLDEHWRDQSVLARKVILELLAAAGLNRTAPADTARRCIDLASNARSKRWRNEFLRDSGIWIIHGHLDPIEDGGRRDRGRQYAVLDDNAIVNCVAVR